MATQPTATLSDDRIERLLASTIFEPEAVLEECDNYLSGQTDPLKRAHAHYAKFRAHSELFRAAQLAAAAAEPPSVAEHCAPDHKREAEFFYNEAARFYRTAPAGLPLPRNILAAYEVEELLGVGEFAYVFRVGITAGKTHMTCALKIFKQPFDIAQPAVDAFRATLDKLSLEAKALPHTVVRIHSVDTDDPKRPFYTMAEISGIRLDHWLKVFRKPSHYVENDGAVNRLERTSHPDSKATTGATGKMPKKAHGSQPDLTHPVLELQRHSSLINIMKQTAVALDAAHRLGVVHLDLKPSNLFVTNTGRLDGNGAAEYDVYLTDFGFLYLQLAGLPLRGISALSDVLDYLAPEIVRDPRLGLDSDLTKYARSDIYAFGKLGLYLFSGPFGQDLDSQMDALVRFDPRLAVLLVRCALPNVAQRPQGFGEVIARLNTVQMDVDERCKQAKEARKDESITPLFKWALRAVRAFSVSPGDIVLAFDDSRQNESKIGGLVPFILFGYAIKTLFLSDPRFFFTMNISYFPCFLAASTCALIGYLYFKYITCRCQYYRSPAREAIRAVQCFQYGIPIVIGVTWPQWWPFCTAAGFLVVAINNYMMFSYMSEYDQAEHLPYLFTSNRRHMTEVLRGYVGSGICGVLGLLIAGGVLVWFRASNIHGPGAYGFELACGLLVAVVNFVLIKTAVVGEPGDRIARTLAQEYAIRDQPVVVDTEKSED